MNKTRGYFGVVVYQPKYGENIGTLWRSAHAFGAAFLATIGPRYHRQPSDTSSATKHTPLWRFDRLNDLLYHIDSSCVPVAVEITDTARDLPRFNHPERALYILGPEDGTLPPEVLDVCVAIVKIPTAFCLNLATAGSVVLYDRIAKRE